LPCLQLNSIISNYLTSLPNPGAWPNFNLGNHDRQRVATRLGHDLVDVLNMVTMLLPGTPITYYGEEIGMVDGKLESPNDKRDPSRTPMQWDSIENAGILPHSFSVL
jgi:glycosidase